MRIKPPPWLASDVLAPYLVTRTLLVICGLLALALLPRAPNTPGDPTPYSILNVFSRWDGNWYISIMTQGYQYRPGEESNLAFAPLYPLLSRLAAAPFSGAGRLPQVVGGLLVSNLALLVGLAYLSALIRLDYEASTATRAAWYLCVFPTTLFLSAIYTESLFMALATAAFYYGRRGQWWVAGAVGGLVALTRVYGVAIFVPLAWEYWASRDRRERAVSPTVLALGLIPVGFALWLGYMQVAFGDPLIFLRVQSAWGRATMWPWETFQRVFSLPWSLHGGNSMLDLGFSLFYLLLIPISWRVLRPGYALFMSLFLAILLSSGFLASVSRYGMTLFPLFILLALAGRRDTFDRAYLIIAAGLASLFMIQFAQWYWVA
jgi:Gpi18-like mannosyltransferase